MQRAIFLVGLFWAVMLLQPVYGQLCPSSSYTPDLGGQAYEWITRVSVHDGYRDSGADFYRDFTTTPDGMPDILTTLTVGQTYSIDMDITARDGDFEEQIRVWFDLNQDNAISHPEEIIFSDTVFIMANDTLTISGDITIPDCAKNGITYMRIILSYFDEPILCGLYFFGETEDYLIAIQGAGENPPTSADTATRIFEDSTKLFASTDFPFSDLDIQELDAVEIKTLPGQGLLRFAGSPIAIGTIVESEDLPTLSYVAEEHAFGENYAQFDFRVYDCLDSISGTHTFSLHVDPVNDTTVLTPFEAYIAELAAAGTVVDVIGVSDVDDSSFSYSIAAGNIGNSFAIDAAGQISVAQSDSLNYTLRQQVILTVVVDSYPSGERSSTDVVIHLLDVEHVTTAIPTTFYLKEFPYADSSIGRLQVIDLDYDTLSYAITGNNPGNTFGINTLTGELFIQDSSLVNTALNTLFTPDVEIYKVATGDTVARTSPLIYVLRPTWNGTGNYHTTPAFWNVTDIPTDPQDRVLVELGILTLEDYDVAVRSVEVQTGAALRVEGGRRLLLYTDYLHDGGLLQAAQDSFIEIRGQAKNRQGIGLTNQAGHILLLQGVSLYFGP